MQNRLRAWLQYVFVALAVVLTVFQLYSTSGIAIFNSTLQRVAHLSLVLCLTFIFVPCTTRYGKEKPEPPLLTVIDIALACLALGIAVFYFQNSNEIFDRFAYVDEVTPQQMFFGTASCWRPRAGRRGCPLSLWRSASSPMACSGRTFPAPSAMCPSRRRP
ncbi:MULTISPECIES: hypothetical protein [unclassified Desulfovibrio]|uniref:hypothetical protein n=1 Tax=unclassified Desulfovibrio TaxID=2593640 RepID=UPI001F15254E|nr:MULTISPECIES: hypothetical protein [unclassified Desulfovibrio]